MTSKEKFYHVIVSEKCQHMLEMHIAFLGNASKSAARKKKNEIIKALKSLSTNPNRYPFFSGYSILPNKYHKMYIPNFYLVLYQVKDDTVFVDYILDCRKDYQWLIESFQ